MPFPLPFWTLFAVLYNPLVVFDFETDSTDAKTCQPIQIAAVVVSTRNLELYKTRKGGLVYFNSLMRPDLKTYNEDSERIHHKKREDLEKAPLPEQVWKEFTRFVRQFNLKKKNDDFCAPIPCGHNVLRYDMVIVQRLCERYKVLREDGSQALFNGRLAFDTMQMANEWFWWSKEPSGLSLDKLRPFLGLSKEGGHDALKDVKDTAAILVKFLGLTEELGQRVKFKDCFGENPRKIGQ